MPTATFSFKDLQSLIGRRLPLSKLKELLEYAKAEIEDYDEKNDALTISFADTNLPYLWSVEMLSLFLKGVLGIEKGIPNIKIRRSGHELIVDASVNSIRPYVAAFVAKGKKVDDVLIKQLIQFQEKICENYGRKREKVAIGIYCYKKIRFPVYYKATKPDSISFVPLDFRRKMTQKEILEEHPKGKEYGWILKDFNRYPILIDSSNEVLSFPPIINSAATGKIEIGEDEIFFEATGTDLNAVMLATNIFAYAFSVRGFEILSAEIKYPKKAIVTPNVKVDKIKINPKEIERVLGIKLDNLKIKDLLGSARYNFKNYVVEVPPFRHDIMHPVDVIEDIGIMYGYHKFGMLPLTSYTRGSTFEFTEFIDKARELMIGLGYQEVLSAILAGKDVLYEKSNLDDIGTVEIENPMSKSHSVVRSWLIPLLLDVLSKNKHANYPQKIFEQGIVVVKKGNKVFEYERIAALTAHSNADFTEAKQAVEALLSSLGTNCEMEETEHNSFIKGRVARILVNKKRIGFVGEISPQVLENFGILVPVSGFEINLSEVKGE